VGAREQGGRARSVPSGDVHCCRRRRQHEAEAASVLEPSRRQDAHRRSVRPAILPGGHNEAARLRHVATLHDDSVGGPSARRCSRRTEAHSRRGHLPARHGGRLRAKRPGAYRERLSVATSSKYHARESTPSSPPMRLAPSGRPDSLEGERWDPDRVRDPDVGNLSPPAERVNGRFAHRERLRGLPDAEKSRHDASFPPLSL